MRRMPAPCPTTLSREFLREEQAVAADSSRLLPACRELATLRDGFGPKWLPRRRVGRRQGRGSRRLSGRRGPGGTHGPATAMASASLVRRRGALRLGFQARARGAFRDWALHSTGARGRARSLPMALVFSTGAPIQEFPARSAILSSEAILRRVAGELWIHRRNDDAAAPDDFFLMAPPRASARDAVRRRARQRIGQSVRRVRPRANACDVWAMPRTTLSCRLRPRRQARVFASRLPARPGLVDHGSHNDVVELTARVSLVRLLPTP